MGCIGTRNITVRAAANGAAYDFWMEEDGKPIEDSIRCCNPPGKPSGDYHEFVFTLDADKDVNLRFADAPDSAMWVKKGWWVFTPGCPKKPQKSKDIEAISVTPDQLVVHNFNPEKVHYKFVLNFVTPQNPKTLVAYDPVWDNQNGSAK